MALIICPKCNKLYSNEEPACPQCGTPTKNDTPPVQAETDKTKDAKKKKGNQDYILTIQFDEKINKYTKRISINNKDFSKYISEQFEQFSVTLPSPCQIAINFRFLGVCKYTLPAHQNLILEISEKHLLQKFNMPIVALYNKKHKEIFKDECKIGYSILAFLIPLIYYFIFVSIIINTSIFLISILCFFLSSSFILKTCSLCSICGCIICIILYFV